MACWWTCKNGSDPKLLLIMAFSYSQASSYRKEEEEKKTEAADGL